jgi:4'-phosphopantetheinyl transferase
VTIEVVLFDLDLASPEIAALERFLDPAERARATAFRAERDRRRFIARRGQLRQLLGERTGVAPDALAFAANAWGKPTLAGAAELAFSLSSSADLALVAFSREGEVGCDIEHRDPALAAPGIARRFFAAAEIAALEALPAEQWLDGFFNCWTRKEAYVKALGLGLSYPLDAFTVSVEPDAAARLIEAAPGWSLSSFQPAPGYQAALVSRTGVAAGYPVRWRNVRASAA